MKLSGLFYIFCCSALMKLSHFVVAAPITTLEQSITLKQAITLATQHDPWLHGNRLQELAIKDKSDAAGTLPDPQVALELKNLASDSWDFNDDPMTQLKVTLTQRFARGDSLKIKQKQRQIEATQYPLMRANRLARLTVTVSELWFDAYLAQQTIKLMNKNKALLKQMQMIAEAHYASTLNGSQQQEVLNIELELAQLTDRLVTEQQLLQTTMSQLNEWLYLSSVDINDISLNQHFNTLPSFVVADELPPIQLLHQEQLLSASLSVNTLVELIAGHPRLQIEKIKQQVANKQVALAEEQYQSQWGINASYAYRDNAPSGVNRADFLSVGIVFDLPIFTHNKQDKIVSAAMIEAEAIKTEWLLIMKKMLSAIEKEIHQFKYLSQRLSLYEQSILKQIQAQTAAALKAYTHNEGDFSTVIYTSIAELNAQITLLTIQIKQLKTATKINYFLTPSHRVKIQESRHVNED